jgi:effector-binding domain-containing protein
MMKKYVFLIGLVLIGGIVWYLFIKPHDYQATFKAKTIAGTINQSIKFWGRSLEETTSFKQEDLFNIEQQFNFGDSIHQYHWKIIPENDSISTVKVYATDVNNSLINKIKIPFSETTFEKRTKKTILDFMTNLNEHLDDFKVEIVGKDKTINSFCACTSQTTHQVDKANGMMKDFPLLNGLMAMNNVTLNGRPILEITNWDKQNDSITFNFCYPILKSGQLPQHKEITYKELPSKDALKAIYNGNYITSDRAWYALSDYAKENNIEVTGLPLEVFHNNPNMGHNEIEWKAEIYMPIKQ